MAPLTAYNLTTRYYFDYITGNDPARAQAHTVMWRTAFDSESTDASVMDKFEDFISAPGTAWLRLGWRVTGVRKSLAGTDFSVPITMTANLSAFVGTGTYTGWLISSEAIERRFIARSPLTGVRGKFSIYGEANNSVSDFRLSATESAATSGQLDILNAATAPLLVVGDNTVPTWYAYASLNYNSHWESALRT